MNNPVAQILASTGNQALLGAGANVISLAVGQLGVFNAKTQLSVDTTATADEYQEFFIAVGTDPSGAGTTTDVRRSAGQYIILKDLNAIDYRCYSATQPAIYLISGFTANCNTEYVIRMGLSFPLAGITYGFNMPMKVFSYTTACCPGCGTDCPSGDCNELAVGITDALNADKDGLFVAVCADVTTTPGTPIPIDKSAVAAWVTANPGLCLGVQITTIPTPLGQFLNGINLTYDYPRVPILNLSLVEGFACNGTTSIYQQPINQQGGGYDLLENESNDSGQNAGNKFGGGPFRTGLMGVPFNNYYSIISPTGKYTQYTLTGNNKSNNGGSRSDTMTPLETTIAIPCADTTTRTAFVTLMDVITAGVFKPMLPANVACPACTVANVVSSLDDTNKDGDD